MPEADELEIVIDEEKDLRIDVKRSSGPGGQSVNTTDSAVRITHLPTGLVVEIQDEKSQHKNKAKAMSVLRSRLYDLELAKQREADSVTRRTMVQAGDRSEKIRTYNFPQDRLTDHRIKLDLSALPRIMDGDLDRLIDALVMADQAQRLSTLAEATMARETQDRVARESAAPVAPPAATADAAGDRDGIRFFEPRLDPIEKATDLGSVQVLKHGNMFMLTDQFGDIHSDSRGLGLYRTTHGCSRAPCSASAMRGRSSCRARPGRTSGASSSSRTRRSTATPTTRSGPDEGLIGKKLGITRERLVTGEALGERVRIVNFAEHDEIVDVTLELADDAADIFEVRGYPATGERSCRSVAPKPRHVPVRRPRRPPDADPRRVLRAGELEAVRPDDHAEPRRRDPLPLALPARRRRVP